MVDTDRIAAPLRAAADAGDVPGVVAAAANADGPIFEAAFGTRDIATGTPMTTDTVVWIASMTKAVTGACAMQWVERGKLSLDGEIADILPELAVFRFSRASMPTESRACGHPERGITLRHLLTHTAGYAYDMWNADIARYLEATGTPGIISCKNAALMLPLASDPGEKWEYGISIDWAGKAVEAVSGQTLDPPCSSPCSPRWG